MAASVLRTIIVDSDREARAAIRHTLAGVPSVAIVGEYDDATEVDRTLTAGRPDVVIVEVPIDPARGDAWSAAAIERLARRLPETAILATAANGSAEFVLQIIRAGAMEFVRRPVQPRSTSWHGSAGGPSSASRVGCSRCSRPRAAWVPPRWP